MIGAPLLALHAPDGLFSPAVSVFFGAVVVAAVALALGRMQRESSPQHAVFAGLIAAFIFAAQMVNFPVAPGTTGHLVGGALAAIFLGPWSATAMMAVVITVQALLGDGGVTALGPNIFNMGLIGTLLGYAVFRGMADRALRDPVRVVAASAFSGWLAVVIASVFASLQLALSGVAALDRVLLLMVPVHMLIGVGEGVITAAIVAFVLRARPELINGRQRAAGSPARGALMAGAAATLVVAVFFSLLPALWEAPDGLERVMGSLGPHGASHAAAQEPYVALLPGYAFPGLPGLVATSTAGAVGAAVVYLLSFLLARVLLRPAVVLPRGARTRDAVGE